MERDKVERFLGRLGEALSNGDLQAISACFAVPALVLSDAGAIVISATDEIERFFAQAVQGYRAQGVASTRPVIERLDVLGEKVASVDVSWPAFAADGTERWTERSHYLLQVDQEGRQRIRVALSRTV